MWVNESYASLRHQPGAHRRQGKDGVRRTIPCLLLHFRRCELYARRRREDRVQIKVKIGIVAIALIAAMAFAATPDFSGSYTLTDVKGSPSKVPVTGKLVVKQDKSSLEVMETKGADQSSNTYSLKGKETKYTSPGNRAGTAKASLNKQELTIEQIIPSADGKPTHFRRRETWGLSEDRKTLTIRTEVFTANSPIGSIRLLDVTYTYTRD